MELKFFFGYYPYSNVGYDIDEFDEAEWPALKKILRKKLRWDKVLFGKVGDKVIRYPLTDKDKDLIYGVKDPFREVEKYVHVRNTPTGHKVYKIYHPDNMCYFHNLVGTRFSYAYFLGKKL